MRSLTDNFQVERVSLVVFGVDLTLVSALVCAADVPDPQYPVVGVFRVNGLQPLVRCVRVTTGTNDVQTFVPHPRDLKNAKSVLSTPCWGIAVAAQLVPRVKYDIKLHCTHAFKATSMKQQSNILM